MLRPDPDRTKTPGSGSATRVYLDEILFVFVEHEVVVHHVAARNVVEQAELAQQ